MKPSLSHHLIFVVLISLTCLGMMACNPTINSVSGIYTGAVVGADDSSSEFWLQLYSNGSFWLRDTKLALPVSTKVRNGTWMLKDNLIILMVMGEKDVRFRWEHGFLRNEAASLANPSLPLDMVALQRIGQ
jgi:hypothetical protein